MKILALAVLAILPATAAAQFTTVITPPKKATPAPAVAEATGPRADSLHNQRLTDMKVWVDSAASALGVSTDSAPAASDSIRTTVALAEPIEPARRVEHESAGRLPDTATPLPLLALLGAALIGVGVWFVRGNRTSS